MRSAILAVGQRVCDRLGLRRMTSLFAAYNDGDATDQKVLEAIRQTCAFLAATYDWQALKARHSFPTVAAETQVGSIPADFLRFVIDTVWDESLRRPLAGPLDDQEWARDKATPVGRIEPGFAIIGDAFLMTPVPPAGRTISYTYIRDRIGRSAGGALISSLSVDTDTLLWDDDLMIAGAVLMHRLNDHDDTSREQLTFERMLADRIKRDGGGRMLRMGGGGDTADDMVARMKSAALIIPQ